MKKGIRIQFCIAIFFALIVPFSVFAQSSNDVKIGKQIWMSKNLDVSTFRNGEPIPEAKNEEEWKNARKNRKAAFSYYKYDPKNGVKYGKLYNWYAVSDSRGLAPQGYHVPSDQEWSILIDFLGGSAIAGFKLKSTSGWVNNANGDNSSGFNGLPGGYCFDGGYFFFVPDNGYFWSTSESDVNTVYFRGLDDNNTSKSVEKGTGGKGGGLSVRCIKD